MKGWRIAVGASGVAIAMASAPAFALSFDMLDGDITGTFNTTASLGAAIRTESQSKNLIGKADLTPGGCSGQYQTCQGLFRDQVYPSERLGSLPGAYAMRTDDGDINYNKGDLTQAVAKITQDLSLNWNNFGVYARWLYFYDFVNNDFNETHRNIITPQNVDQVGITGDPISNRYFTHVYGPGGYEKIRRTDGETLRAVGSDFQLLDANFYGSVPIPFWEGHDLTFKIGRQTVNWGESTLLAIGSINSANPVNANNLYRVGTQVEEVFTPIGMAFASFEPFYGATIEGFYQLEWQPIDAPPPGSYFATNDLGTNNAGDSVNFSFGSAADDPERAFDGDTANTRKGYLDNPLTLITPTTGTLYRQRDWEPSTHGQFGVAFKYYAENLGSGTEFGAYFMNYHSRLPYISFFAAPTSCSHNAKVVNTVTFFQACGNIPAVADATARQQLQADSINLIANRPGVLGDLGALSNPVAALQTLNGLLLGGDPNATLSDSAELDNPRIVFEYPENIHMFGASFNTSIGDYSLQGEVSYRPNQPMQVSIADLGFAALAPTLTSCGNTQTCQGTTAGYGFAEDGSRTYYGSSDVDSAHPDTVNLLVGHLPGSARSYPSFVIPYRGGTVGENPGTDYSQKLDRHNPGYIRGYERLDMYQFDLGFTRVLGNTDNFIGADQIQLVGEAGAVWIPGLPPLDELQIDAPGVYTHASAGADGSGANGSRQACSTNKACYNGPDGLRFNPHQANLKDFVDKFSWGYRLISIIKYESVLPSISLQPMLIWSQDVKGTSPGPAENFVEGRKSMVATLETRYRSALSFTLGYTWYFGGGENNLLRDRDFAQAFVRLQF
ncbi:DUF1302 domain-containing protein [Solimonas marina]|uniref:DUF1302 domain-containing protein n=1 Tax=Solimonas marina TaxID=2714601 RepID=A0A970B5D7_9GAMM|nr:DUF1302 family protein [Solimonas marina]NKF21440.1 DUF1302 domain-containing protein [Solimonas marina]